MNFFAFFLLASLVSCSDDILFFDCAQLISCNSDNDCKDNMAGSCIDGKCFLMKSAGSYCQTGSECASYFYYGPEACSSNCSSLSTCQMLLKNASFRPEYRCCKSIPLGKKCKAKDSLFFHKYNVQRWLR